MGTEPFRDDEHSLRVGAERERASRLAHEIHALDREILMMRQAANERPIPPVLVRTVITLLILIGGVAAGVVSADRWMPAVSTVGVIGCGPF